MYKKYKKFKKIFLHVGPDKTGSTSIQRVLQDNSFILQSESCLYPAGHIKMEFMASFFSEQPLNLVINKFVFSSKDIVEINRRDQAYMDAVVDQINKTSADALILSFEGFLNLSVTELNVFKVYLDDLSDHLEVIFYLRSPLSYSVSAMCQRVRYGQPSWLTHPPVQPYKVYLEKLLAVFSKEQINLRLFDKRYLINGDVVVDFLTQIGLDKQIIETMDRRHGESNTSLSEEAILIGDEISRILGGFTSPQQHHELFAPVLQKIAGTQYCLSDIQKKIINKATKDDLSFIFNEFKLSMNNQDSHLKKYPSGLSLKVAHSLARIIIENKLPEFELPIPVEEVHEIPATVITRAQGKVECLDQFPLFMSPSQEIKIRSSICNKSQSAWHMRITPVNASYHWYDKNKKMQVFDGMRTNLPINGIKPDETVEMDILVKAPEEAGDYFLELTLVQEFCSWLEDLGFTSQIIPVKVKT